MPDSVEPHIFLVGDDPTALEALKAMIENLDVTITCLADPAECIEHVRRQRCDLLITDVNISRMDGIELLKRTKLLNPWVPVLVIGGCGDIPTAVRAIKAGAEDFVEKPLTKKGLVYKISLILRENSAAANAGTAQPLSRTELRVLKLVDEGKTSKNIAESVHRSIRTIQYHRASLMRKLGVKNSVALVGRARALGLLDTEPHREGGRRARKSKKKR